MGEREVRQAGEWEWGRYDRLVSGSGVVCDGGTMRDVQDGFCWWYYAHLNSVDLCLASPDLHISAPVPAADRPANPRGGGEHL